MATSLPVPVPSPRSAWAKAAASLTPSPTMATVGAPISEPYSAQLPS